MSAVIGSERSRVWRALTDPHEVMAWDERMLGPIAGPPASDEAPRAVRWRYQLGPVQTVMSETARSVVPFERLCSERRMGSLRMEQTFSLLDEQGDAPRTRLSMKVVADNRVPVLGEVVDRFAVRRMATAHVDETLRSLQKWCETHP